LVLEELQQRSLLVRTSSQEQQDAVQWLRVGNGPLVELRASQRVHVPGESNEILFVDRLDDPRWDVRSLSVHAATRDSEK
jgi:hypothetical protein